MMSFKFFFVTYAIVSLIRLIVTVPSTLIPEDLTKTRSLLMYDGVCNLCNGFVNFVADHDENHSVIFGAQQDHIELLEKIGAPTDLSTLILVQGDKFYLYSEAALRTFALLDQPYRSLAVGYVVPEFIRDAVYKQVALYRYRIFGRSEKCRTPDPDFKSRFLGYDALSDEDNKFVQDVMVGAHQITKSSSSEF
mmetsp:Transcript_1646/g.2251  ORF Transcript_1646/g.2251 Transcript_1646/m.2251 type:complete len:193 (+) Transcript_1646:77-655(+)